MTSTTDAVEVRVLLKQLDGEVQFLKRAPEIGKIAAFANSGFAYLAAQFSTTKIAENPWVNGFTTVVSAATGAVGDFVKPRYDDMARHSAMMVYGEIYEFNEKGIHKRSCEKWHLENLEFQEAPGFNEHRIAGRTGKTKDEFLQWLAENQCIYTAQNYRASTRNCHHFVKDVCEFLEVPTPSSVTLILSWLDNGGNSVLDLFEKMIGKVKSSSTAAGNAVPFVSSLSSPPEHGSATRIS